MVLMKTEKRLPLDKRSDIRYSQSMKEGAFEEKAPVFFNRIL